jgi:competence protein ComEA
MRIWFACVALCLALGFVAPAVAAEPVDLNNASAEQLTGLDGVGEVLAGRIVEYREANDGFESVAQLEEVDGIGSATRADLEDQVTVAD